MASLKAWLDHHGALVDFSDTAQAPCKDFYHVYVTPKEIIFRWWKIVPPTRADSNTPPSELRNSYDDFLHDERCHSEIQRLAGDPTLQYLIRLAEGHIDYLSRMPDNVLEKIICDLELEDLVKLAATCKRFKRLCNSNTVWEKIFRREVETPVTPELEALAEKEGWKRLFYTNKLQLQMQLRARRDRVIMHLSLIKGRKAWRHYRNPKKHQRTQKNHDKQKSKHLNQSCVNLSEREINW